MTTTPSTNAPDSIIVQTRQQLLKLFNQKHDARLVYHNYPQTITILDTIQKIGKAQKVTTQVQETAMLAAAFSAIGYLEDYQNPRSAAIQSARTFLHQHEYAPESIKQVTQTIESAFRQKPGTAAEALLLDATASVRYGDDFDNQNALLRLELELMEQQKLGKTAWRKRQLDELMQVQFFTPYGKIHFAPKLAQHILKLKKQVEKAKPSLPKKATPTLPDRPFQQLDTDTPNRAVQTFFRTTYRVHINLSAIADNKANIMISVNAVLVSVLITFLSYRNIGETQPRILLPIILFIVTGLTSLTFAVLSARPKVTRLNAEQSDPVKIRRNVAFFGNFVNLELNQFEEAMDAMLRDDELVYGNMSRDLYFLGKVLDRKYHFLSLSYNVFMIGFFATAITFLIVLFL